jgi:hypothetical protein
MCGGSPPSPILAFKAAQRVVKRRANLKEQAGHPCYPGILPLASERHMKMAMRAARAIVPGLFLALAACKDFPGADGRYATPSRGGWDNFRAQSPASEPYLAIAESRAAKP